MLKRYLILVLSILCFTACFDSSTYENSNSSKIGDDSIIVAIIMTVDRNIIEANGEDSVKMSLKGYNAKNIELAISGPVVYIVNDYTNSTDKFSTTNTGAYTLTARVAGVESNKIKVQAIQPIRNFSITTDKCIIEKGNSDGIKIATSVLDSYYGKASMDGLKIDYYAKQDSIEKKLDSNVFLPSIEGEFTLYAKYKTIKSNEIKINVMDKIIERNIKITIGNFPKTDNNYKYIIDSYIGNIEYQNFKSYDGVGNSLKVESDIKVIEGTDRIKITLIGDYKYYYSNTIKISKYTDIYENKLWISSDSDGVNQNGSLYLDERNSEEIVLGTKMSIKFSEKAYYLFKISSFSTSAAIIAFNSISDNIECRVSNSFDRITSNYDSYYKIIKNGENIFIYGSPISTTSSTDGYSKLFILVSQKKANDKETAELHLTDASANYSSYLTRKIQCNKVVMGDKGELYFSDFLNKRIQKWNAEKNSMENEVTFDGEINDIFVGVDKKIFYIAENRRTWQYNTETKEKRQLFNSKNTIANIIRFDKYLLTNDGTVLNLVDLETMEEKDSDNGYQFPGEFLYSKKSDRLFGVNYRGLRYLTVDKRNNKMSNIIETSTTASNPIRLSSDENFIFSADGNIYENGENLNYYGNLGYSYIDMFVYNKNIYLLIDSSTKNGLKKSKVLKLEAVKPYTLVKTIKEYDGEGKRLFFDGENILVVTQEINNNNWDNKYGMINIDKIKIDSLD